MTDKMDEISMIETLRLKTEEIDMDQYLKTKLGGYTKQSVLDYLNVLRKQQQTTADTFYRNLQAIYNEKEAINQSKQALQYRLDKAELEYKNLCEAMTSIQLEDSNLMLQDMIALKNKSAVLEEQLEKSNFDKASLENEIKHGRDLLNDMTQKLERLDHEMAAAKEVVLAEKRESKELRNKVVELTIVIEDKTDEIQYLKALQSEGQVADLTSNVNHLTTQLMTQTEIMGNLNLQVSMKEKATETLTAESELQMQMLYDLNKTVEKLENQNEKLLLANTTFKNQLQESYAKSIILINEKSDIIVEKIVANRKLDEALSKIAMLEMKINRSNKLEELQELKELKG